ncbi:Glycosyltransferase, ALG3 [Kalmanozyma brasiliensis GHG001]|uniref:Dol-P-Man:Man(5)GlcNAc(2)-PP-Dol alpha-1,3-mannosyltransferase n=1 Tax=Kalmanozyma brasiliensis (strain GHG001) TaxID=1365824 RepID=V5ENX1_KALBG|nr:Glycosyltransferase, ALG3 [Kalmanozyma brasiliensis GHG001]EST06800.1 Glycosyltransferase, ALG3 [Kalmanozyma brasiliensis GHG001]
MPPSSLVAFLRRVCFDDYGYTFAFPALTISTLALSQAVIRRISFTEIDFQTYIAQAALFLDGERDYAKIDPKGGSGPCVYPAVHLYIYSFFNWLTDGGANILPAQNVFAGLLTAINLIAALLYRQAGMPPITVLPLILSKRIYSIFLLRMFNDPFAIFLVYLALFAAVNTKWKLSALLFSLGLGVKMNVLLFLPGVAATAFYYRGVKGAIAYMTIVVLVQALVSLPFTLQDPHAYLKGAFDFSRAFLYVWTVNWRFVPEATFLSQHFAKGLLATHALLLALFSLFRWTSIGSQGPQWIVQNLSNKARKLSLVDKRAILCCAFSANVIGLLCSRSLHYQFYSWYFHQVPLLLWFSKLPVFIKLLVPVALEWCWNVFPSTKESSQVLLASHVVLVFGCYTLPGPVADRQVATPELHDEEYEEDEEEDEVDNLLSTDGLRASRKEAFDADRETESDDEDKATKREVALQRIAQARQAKAEKEAKLRKAFRRRIATRRRVLALLGRASLVLRPVLVLLSVALIFVVPHPRSPVSKGTYVDENALQPGQARVYWDYFDVTYADMLSEKVSLLDDASGAERADFVFSELHSYGLETNRQNYRHDAPLQNRDLVLSGTNVYARSATPRIDGREAIILTASWRSRWQGENDPFGPADNTTDAQSTDSRRRTNVRGVASLLVLARYLSTQAHLSKDLIFVISDGYLEGIHAWSSAYFGSVPDGLKVDPVAAGGSQVWNAISIDYPADSFSSLEVQYEGFDGQLPNMDVVNTVVRIADSVAGGMPVTFGQKSAQSLLKVPVQRLAQRWGVKLRPDVEYELVNYENGVRGSLRQVGFGVPGRASGPHGFFQRHHVDAVTLYAVPATGPYGFFHMGRLIESFVRSMSNLLERLHHSKFFYLLLNPRRFVPIGTAILIPLFLSIALTIGGMALWFSEEEISRREREAVLSGLDQRLSKEADVPPEAPTMAWYREKAVGLHLAVVEGEDNVQGRIDGNADRLGESMRPIATTLACVASTVLGGAVVLWHGDDLLEKQTENPMMPAFAARAVLLAFPLIVALILRSRCTTQRARRVGSLLIAFAYLQAGMLVAVLSVLNFALAAFLAILTYAALRIASGRPSPSPASTTDALSPVRLVRGAATLLFSPVLWSAVLHSSFGVEAIRNEVAALATHWKLFGSATVPILCVAYLPIIWQAQLGALLRA